MKTKKQTSDRVSGIASRVLAKLKRQPRGMPTCLSMLTEITPAEVRALAASCLSQDETNGKRAVKKRVTVGKKGRDSLAVKR